MALQQVVPDFDPAKGLGAGVVRPLKRMVRPAHVSFRRGGSLRELVEVVRANRSVAIEASAGAGKSTVVPGSILDSMGGLLVHMLPSVFLARELYAYVSTQRQDCVLVDGVGAEWPESGWVFTSAAVVEAKFLSIGSLTMPECILYHDEVHRSDCWTYLIAHQWGNIHGLSKYVTASATSGVSGFRKLESDGQVTVRTYDPALSDQLWNVYSDSSLPWSVSAIVGNTLIFEDRADHAAHLVKEYSQAGFDVFRLHSRMKAHVFRAAMDSLDSADLTVLVADSTFRDGYTFNISCTIDSGKVQTNAVINGAPARVLRDAFEGEVYQGGARGGRTVGSSMVAWRPETVFEKKRVALEEVEMDAVALVSRLLCTLVPIEAADSLLAEGRVPRDLVSALQGTQPLACMTEMQTVPLASSGYERAPSPVLAAGSDVRTPGLDYYHVGVSAEVGNRHHFRNEFLAEDAVSSASGSGQSRTRESVGTSESSAPSSSATDWTSELAAWASEAAAVSVEFDCGVYYYSPSVRPDVVASADFPEGWASVVRLFGSDSSMLLFRDLSPRAREVAIAAGLQRFNMLSCEKNAVMAVARDVKALGRTRSGPMVHTWMNQLLEKATGLSAESHTVSRLLTSLVDGFCEVLTLPSTCLDVECRAMASHMFESLRGIPVADVTSDVAAMSLKASVPIPTLAPVATPVVRGASDDRYVDMARRGRTARAKPPLTPLGRWIVGYDHNSSVKKAAKRLT